MLLLLGGCVIAIWFILYMLYWSDLIFYWSDPVVCPPTEFPYHYDKNKYDEIFKDAPFENTENKFLIIGCGFSGLSSSATLTRYGIPFDVVDTNNVIGGNWSVGVYESTHIISSRLTTELKDYPMPSHFPQFPSCKQMMEYFHDYSKHFRILERLSLETTVNSIQAVENVDSQYKVEFEKKSNDSSTTSSFTRIYKGVIINNGHHWCRRMPSYEGQSEFTGTLIHSKDYKEPSMFKDKRVLVIGGGNSACDVAVEAARFGKESHISIRRGYYFLPRSIFGKPSVELILPYLPVFIQQVLFSIILRITTGLNYEKDYGIPTPTHKIFETHPTINSELLQYLKLGEIHPHGDIKSFKGGKKIEFKNGEIHEFDVVVCCTGYFTSVPLLNNWVKSSEFGYPKLIHGIFVPNRKNLIYIGLGQPRYGAGCLLTSSCDMIAKLIKYQEKTRHPVGDILAAISGENFPTPKQPHISKDILVDPHVAWKKTRLFSLILIHCLPVLEKMAELRGKLPFKKCEQ